MLNILTKSVLRIRQWTFLRAAQRTLVMLMPIAVIGAFFNLLNDLVFSPDGLIYNIFSLDKIMSDHIWYAGSFVCRGMIEITFGVFGVYASYFMARYTARIYHKDSTMSGMTSVLIMLFCSYASNSGHGNQVSFTISLLQINAVFSALIVGFCVGQVFHLLGKNYVPVENESTKWIQHRAWDAVLPFFVSLALGVVLGIIIYELQIKLLNSASFNELVSRLQTTNNLLEVLFLSLIVTFLNWLGIGYPLHAFAGTVNNAYTAENLTYAFQHGSSWNVPYKYLGSSLIKAYGTMGGASVILAVIVLLLLRHGNKEIGAIARLNLIPAAFGSSLGFAAGLPIILNPVFILPSILIPLINMTLAAGAITLRIIPVCVYPILKGTPGLLISFFGTNGNWTALLFVMVLFVLDLCLMWPFIRINERVELKLRLSKGGSSNAFAQKS
ncbi:PTS sugar transporter subunit IIC [Lactobacillus panisapium]|uniref:PTS sugar transporter subunit IIC n=1 Tax=Lactobacillus panisapium TaxID=2012495 RepID=UPI0022E875F2|nr:PTS sugar transporter subunit IIC [Lactobacillus panisapium]